MTGRGGLLVTAETLAGHMPVLDAAGAQAAARTGLLLDARAGERY
jgi:hypothetical protein